MVDVGQKSAALSDPVRCPLIRRAETRAGCERLDGELEQPVGTVCPSVSARDVVAGPCAALAPVESDEDDAHASSKTSASHDGISNIAWDSDSDADNINYEAFLEVVISLSCVGTGQVLRGAYRAR